MKKLFMLFCLCVVLLGGNLFSQVIFDFEEDHGGFTTKYDLVTSLVKADDPSGLSSGALAATFALNATVDKKSNIYKGNIEPGNAPIITFYVWLPSDLPDSVYFKYFVQDNNWTYADVKWYASAIPKEVWYPLLFNLEQANVKTSSFDVAEGPLGAVGLQVYTGYETDADTTWAGTIYIDNVTLIGAYPTVISDFETDIDSYELHATNDLVTTVEHATDPAGASSGALALTIDADATTKMKGNAFQYCNVNALEASVMTMNVWCPTEVPDGIYFKFYVKDNNWTTAYTTYPYYASAVPKEVWFPLQLDLEAAHLHSSSFDVAEGDLRTIGIEVQSYNVTGDDTLYTGLIYVDDVKLLGTYVPPEIPKYVVATFEKEAAGTQGFTKSTSAGFEAGVSAERIADPTEVSDGVLSFGLDFSKSTKGYVGHSNLNVFWSDTGAVVDTGATAISIDVWVPTDLPASGATLQLVVRDNAQYTWNQTSFTISDSTIVPGQWNTVTLELLPFIEAGTYGPLDGNTWFGVQLGHSSDNSWAGNIYLDNVTLIGIEEPEGTLQSPITIGSVETYAEVGVPYDFIHLAWVDNTIGSETYQVFMSEAEITDVDATGVIRIADQIPHGTEAWNYRPYSRTAEEKTYYLAVISMGADGTITELTDECKVGPITITTSETAKALYDPSFGATFTLDGQDTEFTTLHKTYAIQPYTAGGTKSAGWTQASTDMNFSATFVVDDDYLYISADVTDDDLNASGDEPIVGGQAWMGDALEFYLGVYDMNLLTQYHGYRDVMAEGTGDYRISFCAWGEVQSATTVHNFPGLESTHYQKFTGDGYIIEARIALDSLAQGGDIVIADGVRLPLRIDGCDLDPQDTDESRSLIVQWGHTSNSEDWLRPSCWASLEVLVDSSLLGIADAKYPGQFQLYNNYPNPFNPTTALKFDLPKTTHVKMIIYDILGHEVRTLVNEKRNAGTYIVNWDGRNNYGIPVTSGFYFCRFVTAEYSRTQKMMMIK